MSKPILLQEMMQDVDRKTIQGLGLESKTLMELAGFSIFNEIERRFNNLSRERIGIFCGTGNNGGDGFVVARFLSLRKPKDLEVYVIGDQDRFSTDAKYNHDLLKRFGVEPIFVSPPFDNIPFDDFTIIIDALLGTGVKGEIRQPLPELIMKLNSSNAFKIAVDIPTGIYGDMGQVSEITFKADLTITIGALKASLLLSKARGYCGERVTADIGFPRELLADTPYNLIERVDISIPRRSYSLHKYSAGSVAVFGGSMSYSGAVVLTSLAALRSGSGMVHAFVPYSITGIAKTFEPSLIVNPLSSSKGVFDRSSLNALPSLERFDAIAIGPGITANEETLYFLKGLLEVIRNKNIILDADALNLLAIDKDLQESLKKHEGSKVLTPHIGEFRRLIDKTDVEASLLDDIVDLSKRYNAQVLLKGMPTLVADTDGRIDFIEAGNPGMATAGSGDVLTGIIAGFWAHLGTSRRVTSTSAFIHGLAGNLAKEELGEYGMIASDVLKYLPYAMKEVNCD